MFSSGNNFLKRQTSNFCSSENKEIPPSMKLANSSVPETNTCCLCSVHNMVAEDSADLHHLGHGKNSWNHPASKFEKTPQFLIGDVPGAHSSAFYLGQEMF